MSVSVGAVIVAYNPNSKEFPSVINAVIEQVDCLVIVNNGEKNLSFLHSLLPIDLASRFNVIENNSNLGIATALNYGIKFLIDTGCSHVIFLDQDSLIPRDMVSMLCNTFIELSAKGLKLAAIGPSFFDTSIEKLSPFIRFKKNGFDLVFGNAAEPLIPVHLLITSGTFTSVEVINNVGLMEDGLFIDCVDNEWCLRAISKGYEIIGDSRIKMEHTIGDNRITIGNKKFHNHSPLRHYYIARNSIHLFKRSYIPFNWRLAILLIAIKLFIFYSLVPYNRFTNFRMMVKGFYHGVVGKFGRYDLVI